VESFPAIAGGSGSLLLFQVEPGNDSGVSELTVILERT
jgi:hypothetical protein